MENERDSKSWKRVNKFRLFTIVGLSILTSLSLSLGEEIWKLREVITAFLQAGIAAFAYLQCPTFTAKQSDEKEEKL